MTVSDQFQLFSQSLASQKQRTKSREGSALDRRDGLGSSDRSLPGAGDRSEGPIAPRRGRFLAGPARSTAIQGQPGSAHEPGAAIAGRGRRMTAIVRRACSGARRWAGPRWQVASEHGRGASEHGRGSSRPPPDRLRPGATGGQQLFFFFQQLFFSLFNTAAIGSGMLRPGL
jgi:hypothetical protein